MDDFTETVKSVQEEEEGKREAQAMSNVKGRAIKVYTSYAISSLSRVRRIGPMSWFPRQLLSLGGLWQKHSPRKVGLEVEQQQLMEKDSLWK